MNLKHLKEYTRLKNSSVPVYVMPEAPVWFIPNQTGDRLVQRILSDTEHSLNSKESYSCLREMKNERFISLIPENQGSPYRGRSEAMKLTTLKEFWFHITNSCNLACRHCLFSCSPKEHTTLSCHVIQKVFNETYQLGTRIYYLTGGEPLIHPEFEKICTMVLSKKDTTLVILTNGLLLHKHRDFIKNLPADRVHFQVSLDGTESYHDSIRGKGAFKNLMRNLQASSRDKIKVSLAMVTGEKNAHQMREIIIIADRFNISNVHYMWLFSAGKSRGTAPPPVDLIFENILKAEDIGDSLGVEIDNIKSMESRVFSIPGTKHDLCNAGWESLALGPDGNIWPTPALIESKGALCGHASQGIEEVWKKSPLLEKLRNLSVINDHQAINNPLKFIIGGGDIDHNFHAGGSFSGSDPYLPLYEKTAIWLLEKAASKTRISNSHPEIVLRMGDRVKMCDMNGTGVSLTRSNCVLFLADTHSEVGAFYKDAANKPNQDIKNPVCYSEDIIKHIPESARVRSYGCGSPVLDADIKSGETMVDLGSGAGMECFIASYLTGPEGKIRGIDMLDNMLGIANKARDIVTRNLGFSNVTFKKGFLEDIPLENDFADAVISNCVVNLSEDKTRTFAEIFRILKPGGRAVISDVTTDSPFPAFIQSDPKLRGECIGGAMEQSRLMAMLETTGFRNVRIIKRFFYREIRGYKFHSLTYSAIKPAEKNMMVMYPGPFAGVVTDCGKLLPRGKKVDIPWPEKEVPGSLLFSINKDGYITNQDAENGCSCEAPIYLENETSRKANHERKKSGCMKCGTPLVYLEREKEISCNFCGKFFTASAVCETGHYICDSCHQLEALPIVKNICISTKETDTLTLLEKIRSHPAIPLHGPEHHFIVPGVITATYRNLGGDITEKEILSAIERGAGIPGGSCAFWGGCGAAMGTGIAFGIILGSNPLKPRERKKVQQVTGTIITEIGELESARCCRRETITALKTAAAISTGILPVKLKADGKANCFQYKLNKECPHSDCPYFPEIHEKNLL